MSIHPVAENQTRRAFFTPSMNGSTSKAAHSLPPLARTVSDPTRVNSACRVPGSGTGSEATQESTSVKLIQGVAARVYSLKALGVSGGPGSIALCLLTAHWKANCACVRDNNGYIDGLLAIIVDHGLRTESKEKAEMVSSTVSKLGISCEIATGEWSNGRLKQGHLQEQQGT